MLLLIDVVERGSDCHQVFYPLAKETGNTNHTMQIFSVIIILWSHHQDLKFTGTSPESKFHQVCVCNLSLLLYSSCRTVRWAYCSQCYATFEWQGKDFFYFLFLSCQYLQFEWRFFDVCIVSFHILYGGPEVKKTMTKKIKLQQIKKHSDK